MKKIKESMENVSVQLKAPISPGARGLAFARSDYKDFISKNSDIIAASAADQLAWELSSPTNIDETVSGISQKFKIASEDLSRIFKKNYGMSIQEFAKHAKKKYHSEPKKI